MEALCAACRDPLTLTINEFEDDEDDTQMQEEGSSAENLYTVPDDVHLGACGCHFHWQCLLDAYSINNCPNCSTELVTHSQSGGQQILCNLNNEGGLQENLDILPLLTEESYLKAYPEERKARAFLEFCRAGDLKAVVEMIKGDDEEDEDDDEDTEEGDTSVRANVDILRYQDPIGEMQSALHCAVEAKSRELAWLLLLLVSKLDLQQFPALVFQEAAAMQIMRDDDEVAAKEDIRSLRDAQGRTAEQLAAEVGSPWQDWLGNGLLSLEGGA